jgi:phosphatidylcholine synthase
VLHPVRVTRMRGLNLALMALWGVLAIVALARNFDVAAPISIALCAIAFYVVGGDAVIRFVRPAGA